MLGLLLSSIWEQIQKQKIKKGDIVFIEANIGKIKRVGRCDVYSTEYDLENENYVPIPNGNVHKKKEVIQNVTLHDLDCENAKPQVSYLIFCLLLSSELSILLLQCTAMRCCRFIRGL